jgi:DNA-directed RNA polymerase subunit RPC12/RpoP
VKDLRNAPALICSSCSQFLYEADKFRIKCLEADEFFSKLSFEEAEESFAAPSFFLEEHFIKENDEDESDDDIETPTAEAELSDSETESIPMKPEVKKMSEKAKTPRKKWKPYRPICGYCGKEQGSKYQLRQHELLAHTSIEQLSPDDLFVCDFCARPFKTKLSLRNHFIRAHTPKNESFPCSKCGKVLSNPKALYYHERIHIKTEVSCPHCGKVFSRNNLLSEHIAIIHLKKRM